MQPIRKSHTIPKHPQVWAALSHWKKKKAVEENFVNMGDTDQKKAGFENLKKIVDNDIRVIVCVCGGDGSITWIIEEMAKHKVDFMKAPITTLPMGTGNDFSQELGWGATI